MHRLVLTALLLACGLAQAEPGHRCAEPARKQAQQLLKFHFGDGGRIEFEPGVKVLPPVRNPANKAQHLDVLEFWAYIYKGQYRLRLLYGQSSGECVLMGQEVLEYADL